MPNVNKVVYGNDTIIDLTSDTVTPNDVLNSKSFHDASGTLRTGSADLSKYYSTDDTAETTLDDADYVPFYDTSATAKRKTLWSNIKSVLKTYFDTTYSNKISSPTDGNFVCVNSNGAIYSSNFSWLDLGGQYGLSEQTINYDWDLGYDVEKQMEIIISEVIKYQALDADEPGSMNTKYPIQSTYRVSQTVTLSTSADTSVMFGGQNYGFDSPYSQTYLIAPSSGKRDKVSIITTSLNDISYKSCSIDTTNHTCTVVFPPYSSAANMDVEIFLY